jgi:hypothetical protein
LLCQSSLGPYAQYHACLRGDRGLPKDVVKAGWADVLASKFRCSTLVSLALLDTWLCCRCRFKIEWLEGEPKNLLSGNDRPQLLHVR